MAIVNLSRRRLFYMLCIYALLFIMGSCEKKKEILEVYRSEDLIVEEISPNSYIHISYLDTDEYGKVPCNGMVFIDQNEAVIVDTPASDKASIELIDWLEGEMKTRIISLIVSHFHVDAAGGLASFHEKGIISFANHATIDLIQENDTVIPNYGIKSSYKHRFGNKELLSIYVGEGHTKDNIIAYFPADKVLFGGCLVKAIGAGKGNLKDANIEEWPRTIEKLKALIPNVEIVVPGHGNSGGQELLDYTIDKIQFVE